MDYAVDLDDISTFPEEIQRSVERGQALADEDNPAGRLFRAIGFDPNTLRERHTRTILEERLTQRQPVPARYVDDEEEENQRRWKCPETYRCRQTGVAFGRQIPFLLKESGVVDKAWCADIAADSTMAMSVRIDLVVSYLNNFWVFIADRGKAMIGRKEPSFEGLDEGSFRLVQRQTSEFEKAFGTWTIYFRTSEHYNKAESEALKRLFGPALTRASDIPKPPSNRVTVTLERDEETESSNPSLFVPIRPYRLWFNSRLRRTVTSVVYDATPEGQKGYVPWEEAVNLWQGFSWPAEKVAGKSDDPRAWKRAKFIFDHIRYKMCNGELSLYMQFLYHLGHMLQRPWKPLESTHVFKGPQGIGKSIIIDMIMTIIGKWQCYKTTNIADITGLHTQALENKFLIYLNEAG